MSAVTATTDLSTLARQINAAHDALVQAYGDALGHARAAGLLLIDAKAKVPHGAWGDWIKTNCRFSDRTARVYAQIARDWPKIEAKRQSIADLSMAKAIEIISPPTQPKAAISTPSKPVVIEAKAREIVAGQTAATKVPPSQLRREPTPEENVQAARFASLRRERTAEEKAAAKLAADLVDRLAPIIRRWRLEHREATDEIVQQALEDLKNGAGGAV